MIKTPPPLPQLKKNKKKNFSQAVLLNLFLPGAGLVYAGQRISGFLISFAFVACFVASMATFLYAYTRQLSLAGSDDFLNNVEQAGDFPTQWLITFFILGTLLLIASMIALFATRKSGLETLKAKP